MLRRQFLSTAALAPALTSRLLQEIDQFDVVSTHEHLFSESERLEAKPDFFGLANHYLFNDLVSAGMPADANPKRWSEFEPYWRHARFTGYAQALRLAMRDLYGVAEISAATLPALNHAIAAATKPGLYRYVLKQRGRFRYAVLDDFWHGEPVRPDPEFFVLARKFDWFCSISKAADIHRMEEVTGVSITSVANLKRSVERRLQQSLDAGLVTIKTTLAYNRPLHFEAPSETQAQTDFDLVMRAPQAQPPRNLSDHMFHHVLQLAESHHLPMQVHTGLQAGNGNTLTNSQPTLLNNLFLQYPKLNFDLFHLGWPWVGETAALAKMLANVYVDFCWTHVVAPGAARSALHLLLETVPANKILGFGGDYRHVELSYAHSMLARRSIARVLAEKVADGFCTESEALALARLLPADNAARLFPYRR